MVDGYNWKGPDRGVPGPFRDHTLRLHLTRPWVVLVSILRVFWIATRYVTHRYPVQLSHFQIVRRDRVVRVLFVGEGVAVGFAFLAHSLSIVVISHVPWYLVEQAPHGLPRFTGDFRMV